MADLDREVQWYRDTLGFTVYSSGAASVPIVRFALLRQGIALLELLQRAEAKPLHEVAPDIKGAYDIHGFFKAGFVVDSIAILYKRLQDLGVTFAYDLGQPRDAPYRSFGLRDPEGNLLQFFGE